MTVYVANDAKKARVGCDVVESIESYMDDSSDAKFLDSATCDTSKGSGGTTPLSPRNAGSTAGKVVGALGALALAVLTLVACRQSKKSRTDDVEYNQYVDKLHDESHETFSVASTQDDGSTTLNRSGPESPHILVKNLEPIGEGPSENVLPLQDEEQDCLARCCGAEACGEAQANVAACIAATVAFCAADDIKENFQVCHDQAEVYAGEVGDNVREAIQDDVELYEENTKLNVSDLGADMADDVAALPGRAAEAGAAAGAAAVAAAGACAVAVAAAITPQRKPKTNEEEEEEDVFQDIDDATTVPDVDPSYDEEDEVGDLSQDISVIPPPPPRRKLVDAASSEEEESVGSDKLAREQRARVALVSALSMTKNVTPLEDSLDLDPVPEVSMSTVDLDPVPEVSDDDEDAKPRNKEAIRESALENIDEALKGANWVGVLQVANEMSREEDTDATDSDEEQPRVLPATGQRLNVVEEEEDTEASPATMDEVWEELF